MISILILGGFGYLGLNLVYNLKNLQYNVIIIDNFKNSSNYYNIDQNLKYYNIDIRDKDEVEKIFNKYKIDIVIWSIDTINIDMTLYYDINITGLLSTIMLMNKMNIKNFIFISSNTVYGNATLCQENQPCQPSTSEGKLKLVSEDMIANIYFHNFFILRIGYIYGRDQTSFIGYRKNIINQIELYNKKLIKKFNIDKTLSDYIHIKDLINAILKSINKLINKNKEIRIILNIGSGNIFNDYLIFEKFKLITNNNNINYEYYYDEGTINTINNLKALKIIKWSSCYLIKDYIKNDLYI